LAARLEKEGLLSSKDMYDLRSLFVSSLSRIDLTLAAMSRSLVVVHDRIESTAQKMENMMNMVSALMTQKVQVEEPPQETNLGGSSQKQPMMEEEELYDTQKSTQEAGTTPDITCYETTGLCKHHQIESPLWYGGTTVDPEWESLEELMKNYQERM
jgi:hypothetical protein